MKIHTVRTVEQKRPRLTRVVRVERKHIVVSIDRDSVGSRHTRSLVKYRLLDIRTRIGNHVDIKRSRYDGSIQLRSEGRETLVIRSPGWQTAVDGHRSRDLCLDGYLQTQVKTNRKKSGVEFIHG